jgi:hypothetical protein
VCPHFQALQQDHNSVTRHNTGQNPLKCPPTAERESRIRLSSRG